MKFKIVLLFLFITFNNYSQSEINVELKKIKKEKKGKKIATEYYKYKELERFEIKFKAKSINSNFIDFNKFSLVDKKNKLRYRPLMAGYRIVGFVAITELSNKKIKRKGIKLGPPKPIPLYKPKFKDTYLDYNIDDYKDVKQPLNYNTKKKPLETIVYFKPINKKEIMISFRFFINGTYSNSELELYYGLNKVMDINP